MPSFKDYRSVYLKRIWGDLAVLCKPFHRKPVESNRSLNCEGRTICVS